MIWNASVFRDKCDIENVRHLATVPTNQNLSREMVRVLNLIQVKSQITQPQTLNSHLNLTVPLTTAQLATDLANLD